MTTEIRIPRIVVGGVASGVGKTTLTIGVIAALKRRGFKVAPFKAGPDYLDPGFHRLAAGQPSWNIDGWMMGREAVLGTFARCAKGADFAIVEGVMGLFDGASPTKFVGSTAEIANWLDAPVILVADAGGMAGSFAALCQGYANFDDGTRVAGVIANRLGSPGHLELLRSACKVRARTPHVVGGFPKDVGIELPERHLGLVTADPELLSTERLDLLADLVEEWIDVDTLLDLGRSAPALLAPTVSGQQTKGIAGSRPNCRIGIARDDAFHFYYEENLHLLQAAGAELVPFSPIADAHLPDVDGLYIGGGYPELFAEELAANQSLREELHAFAVADRPVYAECGGMMYLQRSLRTLDGREHAMVGVLDGIAVMQARRAALGYVEVELERDCLLGSPGVRFRGHQFRYSQIEECTAPSVYRVRSRRGREATSQGYSVHKTIGSYVHGHWASHPQVASQLVASCTGEVKA